MELSNLQDEVIIIKNFIPQSECIKFLQRVPAPYKMDSSELPWEHRLVDIIKHPVTKYVENYWNKYFKTNKLKIYESLIQLWPIQSKSDSHIHTEPDRAQGTYNSILYLNDNFFGGEFFTNKITIKPKPGMLTFFNGKTTNHGLHPVHWNNRYAITFWFN